MIRPCEIKDCKSEADVITYDEHCYCAEHAEELEAKVISTSEDSSVDEEG